VAARNPAALDLRNGCKDTSVRYVQSDPIIYTADYMEYQAPDGRRHDHASPEVRTKRYWSRMWLLKNSSLLNARFMDSNTSLGTFSYT